MTLARTSIALLAIQLAIVSSVAAKYLHQRSTCPKVWTRAVAYDPEILMRGRYISAQIKVDACTIKRPLSKDTTLNSGDGRAYFDIDGNDAVTAQLPVIVAVRNQKLVAERIAASRAEHNSLDLVLQKGASCSEATLWTPVDFYISEKARSPFPLSKGSELWVEVTVPPKGQPRPIAMATKDSNSHWQPLNYR